MKRSITIFVILVLEFSYAYTQKVDSNNVYFQALKLHINYLLHGDTIIIDTNKIRPCIPSIESIYYIEQDNYTTEFIPHLIDNFRIEVLTKQDIYNLTKHGWGIHLISIRPPRWENSKLLINVIDFGVTRRGKHFHYTNGGGSSFQVICGSNNRLELKIITQGGI